MTFRVVQPWGSDKARQATVISEHTMAEEAAAIARRVPVMDMRFGAWL
jgi:hypothetical protein